MLTDKRLQTRDLDAANLISLCEICTRRQIQEVIFPNISESVCIRRLTLLYDLKSCKRARYNIEGRSNQYVYYTGKKPSKRLLNHELAITDLITAMIQNNIDVVKVERAAVIGSVIPDAVITVKNSENKIKRLVIEMQLSGTLEKAVDKYNNFKSDVLEHRRDWQTMPRLIVVSNIEGKRKTRVGGMNVRYINLELDDLRDTIFN